MTRHIDATIEESTSSEHLRRAKVNRTGERGAVGVPIFLTAEELEQQGIDPKETDEVVIRVEDGFVLLDHNDPDE
ncbi:hypothetical protein [Halocalculus aciditolerans]|uniref:Uncharacterized protein n=1 Tax=Halocalculus aciditolerans TaxID=1383812 RepID=A0A830FLF0_9EURY|nr:hypothetical protein [Halocalculus aciditolerans]GGL64192.1 hypothetical protein GCM10009039_22560 [Halocalculus aciditolerans]